jgi:2-dehydropantoate 2-reductase
VPLSEDYIEERMKFSDAAPKGLKASMYHDLERGNRLELDWLPARWSRSPRKTGVPVPAMKRSIRS